MKSTRSILALLFAFGLLGGFGAAADRNEKKEPADQFTGTLVTESTYFGAGDPVTIWIDEYTSDEVLESLREVLASKGQRGFRDALQTYSAGEVRRGTNTIARLAIATQRADVEGRIVQLVTDAPLQPAPTRYYPVRFIELTLRPDGTGEGTLGSGLASLDGKKNLIIETITRSSKLLNVQTVGKPQ